MRKKLAALTMCAALAAGSLYGCAPEDGTSASTAAPANIEAQAESGICHLGQQPDGLH